MFFSYLVQKSSLRSAVLASALSAAAGLAAFAPTSVANAGGTTDCSKLKKSEAKAVCKRVGGDEVKIKKAMKAAQKAVKAAQGGKWKDGSKVKCTSCHKKGKGGPLKPASDKYWGEFKTHLK